MLSFSSLIRLSTMAVKSGAEVGADAEDEDGVGRGGVWVAIRV